MCFCDRDGYNFCMQAQVIYNPAAGRIPVGPFVYKAARILRHAGWQVRIQPTRSGEHALELAKPFFLQMDGEARGQTRTAEFSILARLLRLIIPRKSLSLLLRECFLNTIYVRFNHRPSHSASLRGRRGTPRQGRCTKDERDKKPARSFLLPVVGGEQRLRNAD